MTTSIEEMILSWLDKLATPGALEAHFWHHPEEWIEMQRHLIEDANTGASVYSDAHTDTFTGYAHLGAGRYPGGRSHPHQRPSRPERHRERDCPQRARWAGHRV